MVLQLSHLILNCPVHFVSLVLFFFFYFPELLAVTRCSAERWWLCFTQELDALLEAVTSEHLFTYTPASDI